MPRKTPDCASRKSRSVWEDGDYAFSLFSLLMLNFLGTLLATLYSILRSRTALELENLPLRHQIGVLQRSARNHRPKLTATVCCGLEIEVRGKRGVGYCKSMPGAVRPFERLKARLRPARFDSVSGAENSSHSGATSKEEWRTPGPTDLIFPKWQRELFKTILEEEGLRLDREGRPRTAYSLRHTYICLRLMEGADIYQIAKNCRTSVEMIEKYYTAHIKTRLDAAAINVMRPHKFKSKTGSKARMKVQSSPMTSDHTLQNVVALAPSRETGDVEPLKSGEPLELGAKAGEM